MNRRLLIVNILSLVVMGVSSFFHQESLLLLIALGLLVAVEIVTWRTSSFWVLAILLLSLALIGMALFSTPEGLQVRLEWTIMLSFVASLTSFMFMVLRREKLV